MTTHASRFEPLPCLGMGLSAEPDSARKGIDALQVRDAYPDLIDFVEYGTDLVRGLDEHVRRWAAAGLPTTYHFLDLNLEERGDVDSLWLARTAARAREIGAAWLCGDGGLWHFGPRERGHQTLMPPILCTESADEMADSVLGVEEGTKMTLLPENPPGVLYLGDLHLLDYFAHVSERSGCGLLLDCAHLAIYQHLHGHDPLTALDGFPLDRVIELHVAGGTPAQIDGLPIIEDSHVPEPLTDTWRIYEHVVLRASNLRAVVYECEKNPIEECVDNFRRLRSAWQAARPAAGTGLG